MEFDSCVYYKKGYKYQTTRRHVYKIDIKPVLDIVTEYIILTVDGVLILKKGYAWDGPSGPTIDTPSFMRGSLIHDALYQLIREGHLPPVFRRNADFILNAVCIKDRMPRFRAWYVKGFLRVFGVFSSIPGNVKKEIIAPRLTK